MYMTVRNVLHTPNDPESANTLEMYRNWYT